MDTNTTFEGLLVRESGIFKKKSKIWVVLDTTDLSLYRQDKRSSCIGSIKLAEIRICCKTEETTRTQFEIQTDSKTDLFIAESAALADEWVKRVQVAKSLNSLETNQSDKSQSHKTQLRVSNVPTNKDIDDLPSLSKSTFFGVKLKPSRQTTASPGNKDAPTFIPRSSSQESIIPSRQNSEVKTEHNRLSKNTIDHTDASFNSQVNDGPHIINDPETSTSTFYLPVSENVSTIAENGHDGSSLKHTDNAIVDPPIDTKDVTDGISNDVHRLQRHEHDNGTSVSNENGVSTAVPNTLDMHSDGITSGEDVEMRQKTISNKENKITDSGSDVDISGVEMRRSRRSNRNTSTADSWSRSTRSADSRTDQNVLPVFQKDEPTSTKTSSELFELESILGPLLAQRNDNIMPEKHASLDTTCVSVACEHLKQYLETNSDTPFDISVYKMKSENSVDLLKELLNV